MPVKKIYNHLSGKNLKRLENLGTRQQRRVDHLKKDFNWIERNFTKRDVFDTQTARLQNLDKRYDKDQLRLFRDRILGVTGAGAAAGGFAGAASREKTAATSRLLNILKGTRKKAIDRRLSQTEKQMASAYKNPDTTNKTHKVLSDRHDALRKARLKEKAIRGGTFTALGSIPVLGAGHALTKEGGWKAPEKILAGSILTGGAIGGGLNLADKDIENSPSNLAQSIALGAGATAVPFGAAYAAHKNPQIRKLIEKLKSEAK